ncbi:MAG: hypothetical protein FWG41_05920 [Methanomassiliicoccaceae archaeon]|nr:hypothetical protein [Methanomassiliicoccaceae archaeon]
MSIGSSFYFIEGSGSALDGVLWWTTVAALLLAIGILAWFIFFHRRFYDVHKQGSSPLRGGGKTLRNVEYPFSVAGGYSGAVSYRVGEKGQWKLAFPDEYGVYLIPGKEVRGNIYLMGHP